MSAHKSEIESSDQFQEAYTGRKDQSILIGHLNEVSFYRIDVENKGSESKHFHNVFCPERTGSFSYRKNMAFMQGGMEAQRTFKLISDFSHYEVAIKNRLSQVRANSWRKYSKNDVYSKSEARRGDIVNVGVTFDELRWLYDNGYRFESSTIDPTQTIILPPEKRSEEFIMKDYQGLVGKDCDNDVEKELLNYQAMFKDIALQRTKSQKLHHTPKLQPRFNDNIPKVDTADILSLLSISEKSIEELKSSNNSSKLPTKAVSFDANDNNKYSAKYSRPADDGFGMDSFADNRKMVRSFSKDMGSTLYSSPQKYQSSFFNSRSSADTDRDWRRTKEEKNSLTDRSYSQSQKKPFNK